MAETMIYLALTDDWELRGNGSGDIEHIQFRPIRELVKIYTQYGVRSTFNVEVMQQLTFRRRQDEFPELGRLADQWDEHVRDAFTAGQDIQLHVHPQWSGAAYEAGKWRLSGDWSLLNHDPDAAFSMLAAGKEYLEDLLRPIDPGYRCLSFRSGSSVIAPSPFALDMLVKLGMVFDMSIVGGLSVNTRNLRIDYANCEEDLVPFYPRLEDARRVSSQPEPIICVPIFHFYLSRTQAARQVASKTWEKARKKLSRANGAVVHDASYSSDEWTELGRSSTVMKVYDKMIGPCLTGKHAVADIGQLDDAGLTAMLSAIRRRAGASGRSELPVILTNHSKDIGDFSAIERFVKKAAAARDIKFITLTQLAERLESGEFAVRTAYDAAADIPTRS